MTCSNCGKEIMEGATYCLECGAAIDEPVVLSDIKPKNMEKALAEGKIKEKKSIVETFKSDLEKSRNYKGTLLDFSGYVKSLGSDTAALLGFLAAVLMYLAPFFSWLWNEHFKVKKTGNLFELGGKNAELALHSGIFIFMAILIMLSAIDMLAFSGCKYVGPLKAFEKNYIVRALPVVLSLIFFLIVINSKDFKTALDFIQKQEETAERLGAGFNYSGGIGVGPVMLIASEVLYVLSLFMDFAKRKK